jgi:hypothetical protein
MQPSAILLVHYIHKKVAFDMGIFEGRLKRKSQVLVKAASYGVRVSYESGHPFTLELLEGIVECCPKKLSRHPARAGFSRNMHRDIRAVIVLVEDTGD